MVIPNPCTRCDGEGFGPDLTGNCPQCGGGGQEPQRLTGTVLEPARRSAWDRYCYLCDRFMKARVCKACQYPTEKAA